jgi:hypothetical protein
VKILQKFGMVDCKSMEMHMVINMKKLRESNFEPVVPPMHRKLIISLMYLVNTRPYICSVINTLSKFQVEPRHEN